MTSELLIFAAISGVMAFALAKNAYSLGTWLRVLDYPDNAGGRKLHKKPTPLVGGLVSIVPGLAFLLAFGLVQQSSVFLSLFLAICAFLALGLVDDRRLQAVVCTHYDGRGLLADSGRRVLYGRSLLLHQR